MTHISRVRLGTFPGTAALFRVSVLYRLACFLVISFSLTNAFLAGFPQQRFILGECNGIGAGPGRGACVGG